MKLNKIIILAALFLLVIPAVAAATFDEILERAGTIVFSFFQSDAIVFAVTSIFLMVLFYGVFMAGLSRIPSIAGGKSGKTIAVALAVLSTGAIIWPLSRMGLQDTLERILSPIGFFGGVALAFVVFAFFWYSMRDSNGGHNWPMAFIAAGLALVFWGQFTDDQNALAWGWVFLIIGLIGMLVSAFGGGKGGNGGNGGNGGDGGNNGNNGNNGNDEDARRERIRNGTELDNENPGNVTVYVMDIDKHPIEKARVTIGPAKKFSKWFGIVGPRKGDFTDEYTDQHGVVGPMSIGSGRIKIDVDASETQMAVRETKEQGGWWERHKNNIWGKGKDRVLRGLNNIFNPSDRSQWRASRTEVLSAGEDKTVRITLTRSQPEMEGYEPHIRKVSMHEKDGQPHPQDPNPEDEDYLELRGIIK